MLTAAEQLAVPLGQQQMLEIEMYLHALGEYNKHTNLVSDASAQIVIRDHIIDAFTLVPIILQKGEARSLIDIGSGAGLPGLILAIVMPQLRITLVESVAKKGRFLTETAKALGFDTGNRVSVLTARAEEQARVSSLRESFDFAVVRAVGKLDLVAELCLPFLRTGGKLLAPKSRKQSMDEMASAHDIVQKLGGADIEIVSPPMVATGRDLVVLVIEKKQSTPGRYPRPMSQIKRTSK